MTSQAIVLIGLPDSGKTNYLGRLWAALVARSGRLVPVVTPKEIEYVEDTIAHLNRGEFAGRSQQVIGDARRDLVVELASPSGSSRGALTVPDVAGEMWQKAVETFEISDEWLAQLENSNGALLFVRVHSELNVQPRDWVTSPVLLKKIGQPKGKMTIPTQVSLCELLRFLSSTLRGIDGKKPRVAIVVTAWDSLDEEQRKRGPMAYIEQSYPLLAGRLRDSAEVELTVCATSLVGGDFVDPEFRDSFLERGDLSADGYCIREGAVGYVQDPDITFPVAWAIRAD